MFMQAPLKTLKLRSECFIIVHCLLTCAFDMPIPFQFSIR